MSVPKCLFFQHLEGLTEVFGRMSAGTSGRKLPLWADFSFLIIISRKALSCNFLRSIFEAEPILSQDSVILGVPLSAGCHSSLSVDTPELR